MCGASSREVVETNVKEEESWKVEIGYCLRREGKRCTLMDGGGWPMGGERLCFFLVFMSYLANFTRMNSGASERAAYLDEGV